MLERVAEHTADARFYSFDLAFEETVIRHSTRPQATEISDKEMRGWYHGWQPLPFVSEMRIVADETPEQIVERILQRPIR